MSNDLLGRGSLIVNGILYNGQAGGSFYVTTAVTALTGATSVTITDSHITADSLILPFADDGTNEPVAWKTLTPTTGQCVLTFDALEADTDFTLIILSGNGAGGGGGASELDDLLDVTITNPTNGQVFMYNSSTQQWVNADAPASGIKPHLVISTDSGLTVTATKGTTVITATETSSGVYECDIPDIDLDPWTLSDTEDTKSVIIDTATIYQISMTLPVPEGATVTPTDDIETWIKCAGLENTNEYSTLAEVLADTDLFDTLLRDSNACDYMARSTTWAVAEGQVPVMTDDTHPSGTVVYSGQASGQPAYQVFDGDNTTTWASGSTTYSGAYVGYLFDTPIELDCAVFTKRYLTGYGNGLCTAKYQATDDGSTWFDVTDNIQFYQVNTSVAGDTDTHRFTKNKGSHLGYRIAYISNDSGDARLQPTTAGIQFYSADITTDADAMARIGKYDYCADKLSSNSTWAQAISNSAYMESVWDVCVPIMTSNTTPSGVASASSEYGGYPAWHAFASGHGWTNTSSDSNPYVQYQFTSKVKVHKMSIKSYATSTEKFTLQGVDNGSTTNLLSDITASTTWKDYLVSNNTSYDTYRISGSAWNYDGIYLQFYGRADSTVYSPLVPVMTSNTTPSGECGGDSYSFEPYRVFDGNPSTDFDVANGGKVYYHFTSPVNVKKVKLEGWSNSAYNPTAIQLICSDDGTTWTNVGSQQTVPTLGNHEAVYWNYPSSNEQHSYWGIIAYCTAFAYCALDGIQFYQAIPSTTKVHSCPNDTLYITDGVDTEVLCTTDSNGIGSIDWSDFETGTYNIFSSVAKDPSDLTKDYHKSVKVTNTQYGHTTDAYIMPENSLYWFGYMDSDCEELSGSNGWSNANGFISSTFNTNYVSCVTKNQGWKQSGIAKKTPLASASAVNGIAQGVTINTDNCYGYIGATIDKTIGSGHWVNGSEKIPSTSLAKVTKDISSGSNIYPLIVSGDSNVNIYAMWYE